MDLRGDQAASATGPVARPEPRISRWLAAWVRSSRVNSSAPPTAASISDEGSLRPRSISDRYCTEIPARPATSRWVSPRLARVSRRTCPTSSRQSGSRRTVAGGLGIRVLGVRVCGAESGGVWSSGTFGAETAARADRRRNATTSPMGRRYPGCRSTGARRHYAYGEVGQLRFRRTSECVPRPAREPIASGHEQSAAPQVCRVASTWRSVLNLVIEQLAPSSTGPPGG